MRLILALAVMLLAGPAAVHAVDGCLPAALDRSSASVARAMPEDLDCMGGAAIMPSASDIAKHDAAFTRVRPPSPVPAAAFADCAAEGKTCRGTGWGEVRYGAGEQTRRITVQGDIKCSNDIFGDPAPDVVKRCARRPVAAPLLPADITPIASDFRVEPFILEGVAQATSAKPDVVGAFRMICTPGQLNYDDPILYPGVKGGSPHLHQWFGNVVGRYNSTYAGLRSAGESTCSNRLNRSAYWVPALMTPAGKVIVPDFISLYYKRLPDGDPECLRMARKGCVDLPTGLRVVSGYDMARMNEKQPENMSFHFRCNASGKPGDHRLLIAQAIADCGGAGQVIATVSFAPCWNGLLDSADHRSHLAGVSYGSWGYPKCPATHPYIIPGLTQGVGYTIAADDGDVRFSSDLMAGMKMPGGSTFHADYMEAWDPPTRATWERLCIGRLLSCSDGNLGNGTMIKRPGPAARTERLIQAPSR